MIEEHDERRIRCRRLGHLVAFRYCRTQEGRTVCPRILDCWWEEFDVRAFLAGHLPQGEMQALASHKPSDKTLTLLDMIRRAERRREGRQDQ